MTAGDLDNLRTELAVFSSGVKGGGAARGGGEIERPDVEEARGILTSFGHIVEAAVKRQQVLLGRGVMDSFLSWDARSGRFLLWSQEEELSWSVRARRVLGRLLVDYGHLVKECPAPEPRDEDAKCGKWFVANRPRQAFCSPRCQSRAATRAFRASQHHGRKAGRKAR